VIGAVAGLIAQAPGVDAGVVFVALKQPDGAVDKSARLGAQQSGDESSAALQIKVSAGTEIMATAKGKVLYKGTISGLGDVIIIGHQRGFSTVYAKLDNIWVGLNQIVEKGETIGQIAGGRNQALHFEIRFGGKKQLPLPYLPADS